MDTIHTSLTHHEAQKILPWYVNRRLGAAESRGVEAHLRGCPICRREADGLATLFSAHEGVAERPVDEARLDALFARIEQYEGERRAQSRRSDDNGRSLWQLLTVGVLGWLVARPGLIAGALAAVVVAVVAVPMLESPATDQFQVLSSSEPTADTFRVVLRFQAAPERDAIERLVRSGVPAQTPGSEYRIERRSDTEYVVVFDRKPSVTAVSQMIGSWGTAPHVVAATIDDAGARN
jgi:hypothetical protein